MTQTTSTTLTADTITSDHLLELLATSTDGATRYMCRIALRLFRDAARMGSSPAEERQARERCAQIINAGAVK